jgi:pyruvate, water dikinase
MRGLRGLVASLAWLASACDASPPEPAAPVEQPPADERFATHLAAPSDFARLEGEQWAVKYLARVEGRRPPAPLDRPCTFQNTAAYPLHVAFLRTFPELETLDFETYLGMIERRASRVLWAGELRSFPGARHPRTGVPGVMGIFVYAGAAEPLETAEIVQVYRRLEGCVPYARASFVLVAANTEQADRFREQADALAAAGITVAEHAALAPEVEAEGYSVGDGYGYVRVVPPGGSLPADLGPRDLLVVEGASEEIGLVAGLVTALPQNVHSHLNLRLREKGIPNARVSNIFEDRTLAEIDGRLAHLRVDEGTAALEPAFLEDAEAFWRMRVTPITLPEPDLDTTALAPLASLTGASASAYGRKAANLGELYRVLPEANRVDGFGIPFARYRRSMDDWGLAAQVSTLLADPRLATDASYRRAALDDLRDAIEDAEVPPELLAEVTEAATSAFGADAATLPLRFRSSSNVEDGERLSGAGLHDSARGCLADDLDADATGPSACLSAEEQAALQAELDRRGAELVEHPDRTWLIDLIDDLSSDLTKERSVARALKKVYASLWSDRAFEERAYFGIAQESALMGIMVNPSFVLEQVDAVAVTNLVDAEGAEPYTRVVSQIGGNAVVRPTDPTLTAETLTFRAASDGKPTDVKILSSSSLSPAPIWSTPRLEELAGLLFVAQNHFETSVYPDVVPLRLDFEIKVTEDGRVVLKQARPFVATSE